MNKYQEAFVKIKYITNYDIRAFDDNNEEIKLIQELVDKATPKKPIDNSWSFSCPNCENLEVINNGVGYKYCKNCGQALDWSEDD